SMNLTEKGFDLTFTRPVDMDLASDTANYQFRHYYYDYYKKDETEPVDKAIQLDVQSVPVTAINISSDGKRVSLTLSKLEPGYIYELKLKNIRSRGGRLLENDLICYTLNNLKNSGVSEAKHP
ncbi:MAG TPA: hypothetical protein VIQ51_17340, partial [Chryseosolibacter sp.]